jgi:hypothetical protein
MSQSIKTENSLLRDDERDIIARTHFPAILDADDDALADLRLRVRSLQGKERTFVHQLRRNIRAKSEPRGKGFPGDVEKASRRKQVFASATKRINHEHTRRRSLAARESLKASARLALTLKQQNVATHPDSGRTSLQGMASLKNRKRRWVLDRARVGRVLQAGKRHQAARDAGPATG